MIKVDTAALAAHLRCEPAFVLRLARAGIITPVGHVRTRQLGRPAKAFDLDAADDAIKAAVADGRVQLDVGKICVRK